MPAWLFVMYRMKAWSVWVWVRVYYVTQSYWSSCFKLYSELHQVKAEDVFMKPSKVKSKVLSSTAALVEL